LKGLGDDARGDLDLAQEIADAYWRVAQVQGMPTELNLSEPAKAEQSLKQADTFIATVLAARPRSAAALYTASNIAEDRMILADTEHRRADVVAHSRRAAERFDALVHLGKISDSERLSAAKGYANIALANLNMHLYEDGVRYARRSIEVVRHTPFAEARSGSSLTLVASGLRYQGDLEGALQAIHEAQQVVEKAAYPSAFARAAETYAILLREGLILGEDGGINLDRPEEAVAAFQKAFDITEEMARRNPTDAATRGRLASAARELGKILRYRDPQRALALYDLAIHRLGDIKSNLKVRRDLAKVLAGSSYPLRRLHRAGEARQRIDTAFRLLRENKDYPAEKIVPGTEVEEVLWASADHDSETGQPEKAVEAYRDLLAKVMASHPDMQNDLRDAAHMSRISADLEGLLRRAGRAGEAAAFAARRLELWRHWERKLPHNPFVVRQMATLAN
jgi:tetratricopeptide (TPR) repeat protein